MVSGNGYRRYYENYYNIKLSNEMEIHHIDSNRENNDIKNLIAVSKTYHGYLHRLMNQARNGFVQLISKFSPMVYKINSQYVYTAIIGDVLWSYNYNYDCPYNELSHKLLYPHMDIVYAPNIHQLKRIVKNSRMYWNENLPIIEIENQPLPKLHWKDRMKRRRGKVPRIMDMKKV